MGLWKKTVSALQDLRIKLDYHKCIHCFSTCKETTFLTNYLLNLLKIAYTQNVTRMSHIIRVDINIAYGLYHKSVWGAMPLLEESNLVEGFGSCSAWPTPSLSDLGLFPARCSGLDFPEPLLLCWRGMTGLSLSTTPCVPCVWESTDVLHSK